jgi:hypothetical protein
LVAGFIFHSFRNPLSAILPSFRNPQSAFRNKKRQFLHRNAVAVGFVRARE